MLPPERPAVAALIGRLIGNARMVGAVGQGRDGMCAAEEEVGLARIADRPAAGLLGELEQGPALAHRDDVVGKLRLGLDLDVVGVGERGVAPHRGPRDPQHVAVGARLARPRRGRARRLGAARKSEPVHLADHRVAGHAAELAGDLTRRQSLAPKLLQRLDAFVSPAHAQFLGARRGGEVRTESDWAWATTGWPKRIPFLLRCTRTSPPHEMSYSLIETLQYGGSRAQESAPAASTYSGPVCSTHPHLSALLCGALTPEAAAAASGSVPRTVLTGGGAAIKCRPVPPGEAAHFVSVHCRARDE